MRILMVGALSIEYVADNWVEPLRAMADATFIDVSPLLSHYKNGFHEKYIYSVLKSGGYDYLFFYADAINRDFGEEFFETVRGAGIPIISYYADDEPEAWYKQNLPYDHRFDLVGTHSLRGYQRRLETGDADRFVYLPWGFSPRLFRRMEDGQKVYDVVYLGTNSVHKENPSLYLNDGYSRQKMLVAVYDLCRRQGLNFRVFGSGWDRHPVLRECAGGMVSKEEMVRIYNEARIVFNPGLSADDDPLGYQTKLRHFEVAGCGSLQLVNYNPELADLFEEGRDIVFFRNHDEIGEKILYYLRNEQERETMAANVYKKAHSLHTTERRLTDLFAVAQTRFPLKTKETRRASGMADIRAVCFRDAAEARIVLENCDGGGLTGEPCDALHFVGGDLGWKNSEYTTVGKSLFEPGPTVVGVRTFLQLAFLHDNVVQRKRDNILGTMLPEKISKKKLNDWLLGYVKENFLVIEDDEFVVALVNFLVPPAHLAAFRAAFLANDMAAFKQLPVYNSGLVVNDFALRKGHYPARLAAPPYLAHLRDLLDNVSPRVGRILVYGARGNMADYVFSMLKEYPGLPVAGIVDRSMARKEVAGLPVYRFEDIPALKPDMIIIAAETSGPRIYEDIKHLACAVTLVPLYDLAHAMWDVLLPGE